MVATTGELVPVQAMGDLVSPPDQGLKLGCIGSRSYPSRQARSVPTSRQYHPYHCNSTIKIRFHRSVITSSTDVLTVCSKITQRQSRLAAVAASERDFLREISFSRRGQSIHGQGPQEVFQSRVQQHDRGPKDVGLPDARPAAAGPVRLVVERDQALDALEIPHEPLSRPAIGIANPTRRGQYFRTSSGYFGTCWPSFST